MRFQSFFVLEKNSGTCALFRTHSISEVRFFHEINCDAGTFKLNILYIEVVRLSYEFDIMRAPSLMCKYIVQTFCFTANEIKQNMMKI